MDKSKIFEFVKKEYEKGIEDSVIRLILSAKEYHANDIDEVMKAASAQKNLPVEQQVNPFIVQIEQKKVLWGKALILALIQLVVIYFSETNPNSDCVSGASGFYLCEFYRFLPLLIFIAPILIWIINFFFRGKKSYTVIVATIISITIASIVYLL